MHYFLANHFIFYILFLSWSCIVPKRENHIEQNQQQETKKKSGQLVNFTNTLLSFSLAHEIAQYLYQVSMANQDQRT